MILEIVCVDTSTSAIGTTGDVSAGVRGRVGGSWESVVEGEAVAAVEMLVSGRRSCCQQSSGYDEACNLDCRADV
jgi:hypothetical protein